jgi:type IX secretion system PorP/SprF family membrane protein
MTWHKEISGFLLGLLAMPYAHAQDPNFSQFFSSPLNINPALTASINADWRIVSNFRNQWIGPASPYVTGTISYDKKLMQDKIAGVEEKNYLGAGGMMMFDYAMNGIVKSVYASGDLSYSVLLSGGDQQQRLGAGFGAIYGNRYVDFSQLTFEEQFTGSGFNTNLPTGESALSSMKPYLSFSVGMLYSYTTEKSNLDLGAAIFHFNKPKQTWLDDKNEHLPPRYVAHTNFETYLNEELVLNANAIYQFQREAYYYSAGAALGYFLAPAQNMMVHGGMWYWSANAITPYIGLTVDKMQFGFSYDFTVSKLRDAPRQAHTFEFSFIIKGEKDPKPGVPCPWK